MNNYIIKCKSPQDRENTLKVLIALKYNNAPRKDPNFKLVEWLANFHFETYNWVRVCIEENFIYVTGAFDNLNLDCQFITLGKLIDEVPPKIVNKFVLNDSYTAEIQLDGTVKVGCCIVRGEIVMALAKEVEKCFMKI